MQIATTVSPKIRTLMLCVMLCASLAVTACGGDDDSGAAQTQPTEAGLEKDEVSVTLGGYVNEVAAKRLETIASEHGFKVKFVPVKTGADYLAALLTGQADATLLTYSHMFQAFEQGRDDVVAFLSNTKGGTGILVRSDLGVAAEDFDALNALATKRSQEGKPLVLAGAHNSINYVLGRGSLERNGVDISQFEAQDVVDPSLHAQMLAKKEADVLITGEPARSAALEAGYGESFHLPYDTEMGSVNTDWLTTRKFAEENPKTLDALKNAIEEAAAWVEDSPDEAVQSVTEYTGIDEGIARRALRNLTFDPHLQPQNAEALARAMFDAQLVKRDWSDAVAGHILTS